MQMHWSKHVFFTATKVTAQVIFLELKVKYVTWYTWNRTSLEGQTRDTVELLLFSITGVGSLTSPGLF